MPKRLAQMPAKKLKPIEIEEALDEASLDSTPVKSEKEKLLDLYQTLKDLNVRSIGDLENLIARAKD